MHRPNTWLLDKIKKDPQGMRHTCWVYDYGSIEKCIQAKEKDYEFAINRAKECAMLHENCSLVTEEDRRKYFDGKIELKRILGGKEYSTVDVYSHANGSPSFWIDGYPEFIEDVIDMGNQEYVIKCLKSLDDSKGKYKYTIRNGTDYSIYHSWNLPCLTVNGSFSLLEQANVARAMLQSKSYVELLKWFKENKGKAFYDGFGSHVLLGGFELNGMRAKPNGMGWYTLGVRDQLQNYFKDMLQLEYGVGILRVMNEYGHNVFDNMVSEVVGKGIERYKIKLTNTQLEAQKLNGEDIHPIDQMFPDGLPQTPSISTGSLLLFITLMIFFSLFNIRIYLWVFTTIIFVLMWFFNNR